MKRRIFCLLLLTVLLLSGCAQKSASLEFCVNSDTALEDLRVAVNLTDAEFDAWRKANLTGSPVTREQAATSLALLDAAGYPLPEEGSYESMTVSFRPLEDYISIIYRMNGIRYRFVISANQQKVWHFWFPALRCRLDGYDLRLYRGRQQTLTGELYTGDYRLQVIVMDKADRKAVDFTLFAWQGGQWK